MKIDELLSTRKKLIAKKQFCCWSSLRKIATATSQLLVPLFSQKNAVSNILGSYCSVLLAGTFSIRTFAIAQCFGEMF